MSEANGTEVAGRRLVCFNFYKKGLQRFLLQPNRNMIKDFEADVVSVQIFGKATFRSRSYSLCNGVLYFEELTNFHYILKLQCA